MKKELTRRDFFRRIGVGTLGLGFGVSIFDGIYQHAHALTEEDAHALLMKGTVNFMGFMAKEITPNDEFYITTYSSKVPAINGNTHTLRIEGLVEKPYTLRDERPPGNEGQNRVCHPPVYRKPAWWRFNRK